jgi:hypothetical protein
MSEPDESPVVSACYLCHSSQSLNYGLACKRELIVPVCVDCLAKCVPERAGGETRTKKREG